MPSRHLRPLALCVLPSGSRILVGEGRDLVKGQTSDRPLGGGIEFGESSEAAIAREIRQELCVEITGLRALLAIQASDRARGWNPRGDRFRSAGRGPPARRIA